MKTRSFLLIILLVANCQTWALSFAYVSKADVQGICLVAISSCCGAMLGKTFGSMFGKRFGPELRYSFMTCKNNPIKTGFGLVALVKLWKKNKLFMIVCSLLVAHQFKKRYAYAKRLGTALHNAKKLKLFKMIGTRLVPINVENDLNF